MIDFAALQQAMAARDRLVVRIPSYAESAVLVPIVVGHGVERGVGSGGDESLLFTVRSAAMRAHGGQIAFPGGRRDEADPDLIATALREAEEELGIDPSRARVLGALADAERLRHHTDRGPHRGPALTRPIAARGRRHLPRPARVAQGACRL